MDLNDYRKEIDRIDDQLIALFAQRMETAEKIAEYKKANGLRVLDARREKEKMREILDKTPDDLREYVSSLYSLIFELSRSRQSCLLGTKGDLPAKIAEAIEKTPQLFPEDAAVACQGVEGSYAARACDRLFALPSKMYFSNFESVFNAVESGLCRYGVLPIENSSAGSVTEVYDLMVRHKFYIVKSIKLHISHALLAKPGVKLEDVKEVVSHTQALQQCSNFLKANPNIKVTIFENTATAAKYVAESGRTDLAALSSTDCAKLYGLHVLQDGVQNNENNYTRFICIAKNMEIYAGSNRISLMLSLDHRPGSLHEMIGKFACRGINLCKLESRPIPGKDFEFRFYFDLDGSVFSPETMTVLKDIEQAAESLSFLGCYSEV